MRGCLIAMLLVLLVPCTFCASVTHDASVMLVPFVIVSPFFVLGLLLNWIVYRQRKRERDFPETEPTEPVHRGIDDRVKALQQLHNRSPRDH